MAALDYAGYSTLVGQTWTASAGQINGFAIMPQFTEKIIFGSETVYVGYKIIQCQYQVKDSILNGYLYVPESLQTKFIFGNAEKKNILFDLSGGVLSIYSRELIFMSYV
jgi:hypothetical protein